MDGVNAEDDGDTEPALFRQPLQLLGERAHGVQERADVFLAQPPPGLLPAIQLGHLPDLFFDRHAAQQVFHPLFDGAMGVLVGDCVWHGESLLANENRIVGQALRFDPFT